MLELPSINYPQLSNLFGVVLVTLAVFWAINKAILISKED
jgi:hypothetical protein